MPIQPRDVHDAMNPQRLPTPRAEIATIVAAATRAQIMDNTAAILSPIVDEEIFRG